MRILALDSSAVSASVAVMEDEKLVGEFFIYTKQTHSQTLMPMVKNVLDCTDIALDTIDLFAVSAGPGSFTGVRIGVSCVKGMAMAQGKPCVGVSTLEAMAFSLTDLEGIVCAVMDARRQQVYNACFVSKGGVLTRLTEDRALAIDDLAEECKTFGQPIYLVGDGAALCAASPVFQSLENVHLPAEPLRFQRGYGVAMAARHALERQETVDAAELAPVYLRMPQAERELKQRLSKMEETV